MDPLTRLYFYEHWLEDHSENVEFYKNLGYLIGSFTNPEAVAQLTKANTVTSSDEDFDAASEMVRRGSMQDQENKKDEVKKLKKRKRKKIIG